ncbi:GntR family transcriptional regulator [Xanthobacteraceae bacterium A53D]
MSLTDQAYEAIKEKILTLYFLPGQYLNEAAIGEVLQMGRTPVHQALLRLNVEGLVEIVPRKGVVVQPDSIGQILEVLDARLVVETEIARQAAENGAPEDCAELIAILDRHSREHGGGAIDSFVECDRAFHNKISEMSKARILGDFAKTLHERSTRYWYLHLWQTLDETASDRQHRAIVSALKKRDGAAASEAMREHLQNLRTRVAHLQNTAPRRVMKPGE